MKRLVVLIAVALFSAACQQQSAGGSGRVEWQAALDGDSINVDLKDPQGRYRVERVELVGPDQQRYVAQEITRHDFRDNYGYGGHPGTSVGVGVGGGGGVGVGVGFLFPLGGSRAPAEPERRTRATIVVPDAAEKLRQGEWSINAYMKDAAGKQNVATIPAPLPTDRQ